MTDDDAGACRNNGAGRSLGAGSVALIVGRDDTNGLTVSDGAARPDVADGQLNACPDGRGRIAGGVCRPNSGNNEIGAA